jgi:hypothetical protein
VCARRGRSPILIVVAGLLASFGFAYRYAGVTVIAAAILVVVVVSWSDGIKAVLGRAALCAVASLVLPAIISARNLSEGPLFGERSDSVETLSGVLRGLVVSSRGFGVIAFVSVVLALVLLRARGADARSGLLLLPLVVFVSGYLVYIVISELGTRIDPINNRLMSPLFAPTVALVVVCIDGLLDLDWARARPWVTQVISGVVVLVIVGTLVQTARHARARGKSGQGYATAQWQDSELAAAVRALPGAPPVYSNERYGLYLTTGRQPILESPQPTGLRRALARSDAPTYLAVWTHQSGASQFSASRLEDAGLRVEETARADDGVLYRVSAP